MTLAGVAAVEAEGIDEREQVRSRLLRLGMWSAWAVVGLGVAYIALVAGSGALSGAPIDPFWAAAEAVTVVGAPIQVVLFAVIFQLSPAPARVYGLLAFGFMLAMAALTTTVHLTELFVARRIDLAADPALGRIFGFTQPSLVFAIDVSAWRFLFGLSLLFAALAFTGPGTAAYLRGGFAWWGAVSDRVGGPRRRQLVSAVDRRPRLRCCLPHPVPADRLQLQVESTGGPRAADGRAVPGPLLPGLVINWQYAPSDNATAYLSPGPETDPVPDLSVTPACHSGSAMTSQENAALAGQLGLPS